MLLLWGLIIFVSVFLIMLGKEIYKKYVVRFLNDLKENKKEPCLCKVYANVDRIEGINSKSETTVKLYPDRITFNDFATIPLNSITTVSTVHQFIRQKGGRRYYYVLPYYHDMTINFNSSKGYETYIRLEREGRTSNQFINFRNQILKLKGIEERPFQPPSKPYQL